MVCHMPETRGSWLAARGGLRWGGGVTQCRAASVKGLQLAHLWHAGSGLERERAHLSLLSQTLVRDAAPPAESPAASPWQDERQALRPPLADATESLAGAPPDLGNKEATTWAMRLTGPSRSCSSSLSTPSRQPSRQERLHRFFPPSPPRKSSPRRQPHLEEEA